MEFRPRDYRAEESAASLPRTPAQHHPLVPLPLSNPQAIDPEYKKVDFDDPLRTHTLNIAVSVQGGEQFHSTSRRRLSTEAACFSDQEWTVFRNSLMQQFTYSNTISVSSMLYTVVRSSKDYGKSLADVHLEELDDPEVATKDEENVITRKEYVSRLQELKGEISQAWRADDRVKALKLSIKVARLLMDTTVSQFYPTLFILVIDILDMLGDLVWERIKRKAEYSDDGTLVYSLSENFKCFEVCSEAKDTCYNWFCKIGSIRELLPRIYLELAIVRCRRFLEDNYLCTLQRLTMMMRGLADPLASAYCRLYMARCAGSLNPGDQVRCLIPCMRDVSILLRQIISNKETSYGQFYKSKNMLIMLMKPAIEWIMKCIFMDGSQKPGDVLVELGFRQNLPESTDTVPCISVVLHYLLKQLPAEYISVNALEIVGLLEQTKDISFDQHLNYRLLGHKLYENPPPVGSLHAVLNQVIKVLTRYNQLDEYLKVADAYLDIILHYPVDNYLSTILDGILKRAQHRKPDEEEVDLLQSILVKLISYFGSFDDLSCLDHFTGILELLYGSSRNMVNMQLLKKATRTGYISDPTTIQMLFEISKALHDSIEISHVNDDYKQRANLISSFVQMVDFGAEKERHLAFLVECRAAFSHIDELKDTVVHLSNHLAVKAMKSTNKYLNFLKACMAFNEVTIPSISGSVRRMKLYLETAEVALCGGLVFHTEGLINSVVSCLHCLNITTGSDKSVNVDEIVSLTCKLCSILVMVPGTIVEEITCMPQNLISVIDYPSLTSSRFKLKILCAIVSLAASISQNKLPYHANNAEVVGNDQLFYGDASYRQELLSISNSAVQKMFDAIEEEPNLPIRGKSALEACNCLISSFKANEQLSQKCSKLIEIAKSCMHPGDKYLESTMNSFEKHLSNL